MAARRGSGDGTTAKANLPDAERDRAGDEADEQRAEDACAAVKGGHAGRQSDKERQRVDGEREHQPAEEADAERAEDESDDEHGGAPRDKGCDGRAFHHHHGALGV